jgi:hypothetical protein
MPIFQLLATGKTCGNNSGESDGARNDLNGQNVDDFNTFCYFGSNSYFIGPNILGITSEWFHWLTSTTGCSCGGGLGRMQGGTMSGVKT